MSNKLVKEEPKVEEVKVEEVEFTKEESAETAKEEANLTVTEPTKWQKVCTFTKTKAVPAMKKTGKVLATLAVGAVIGALAANKLGENSDCGFDGLEDSDDNSFDIDLPETDFTVTDIDDVTCDIE